MTTCFVCRDHPFESFLGDFLGEAGKKFHSSLFIWFEGVGVLLHNCLWGEVLFLTSDPPLSPNLITNKSGATAKRHWKPSFLYLQQNIKGFCRKYVSLKWFIKEFLSSFVYSQLCKEISLGWRQKGETFHPVPSISSYKLYLDSVSQTDKYESANETRKDQAVNALPTSSEMNVRKDWIYKCPPRKESRKSQKVETFSAKTLLEGGNPVLWIWKICPPVLSMKSHQNGSFPLRTVKNGKLQKMCEVQYNGIC